MITKVNLKPLQRVNQLKKLTAGNLITCGYSEGQYEMIFRIGWKAGKEVLQDLTIIFEKRSPSVYISDPYTEGNGMAVCNDAGEI